MRVNQIPLQYSRQVMRTWSRLEAVGIKRKGQEILGRKIDRTWWLFGRQRKEVWEITQVFCLNAGGIMMLITEWGRSYFIETVMFHFNVLNMRYKKTSIWQLEMLGSARNMDGIAKGVRQLREKRGHNFGVWQYLERRTKKRNPQR